MFSQLLIRKINMFRVILIILPLLTEAFLLNKTCSASIFYLDQPVYTFWNELERVFMETAPPETNPDRLHRECIMIHAKDWRNGTRPDVLTIKPDDLVTMREKHAEITNKIPELVHLMRYNSKTRGIVTTCGLRDLGYLAISLRMLRFTGSTLPVEILLASVDDYHADFCEDIFPQLNARCILMSDVLNENIFTRKVELKTYQFKIIAILFSSFEEVLFLDADNIPVSNPDLLFTSEPFKERGMITWLDFWAETVSPLYYKIINEKLPDGLTRVACEAGELLFSKKVHAKTLLLAAYYNYYGPSHYYRLFSQNAPGEGDKETFIMAAEFYKIPFYTVQTGVEAIGHKNGDEFRGIAMTQRNAIDDWDRYVKNKTDRAFVRIMFIHANYPKVDPNRLLREGGPILRYNGTVGRMWENVEELKRLIGYDSEVQIWKEFIYVTCKYYPHLCQAIRENYEKLFK
jgi:alpha 1,2-mannosyltransferase